MRCQFKKSRDWTAFTSCNDIQYLSSCASSINRVIPSQTNYLASRCVSYVEVKPILFMKEGDPLDKKGTTKLTGA